MHSKEKKQLEAFLRTIPEQKAEQLAVALERERLAGSGRLPHDDILGALRPTLKKINSDRAPSALRLLCAPFEDLIRDTEHAGKRPGRIARSAVQPIWRWLNEELLPDKLPKLSDELKDAVLAGDEKAQSRLVTTMRGLCAGALSTALSKVTDGSKVHRNLSAKLGHADVIAEAREIALLLEVSDDLEDIQVRFPKPIQDLGQEDLIAIKDCYDYFAERMPEAAPYPALIVMRRLTKPWLILRLSRVMAKSETDRLLTESDLRVLGDLLFADMEEAAGFFQNIDSRNYDVDQVLVRLGEFARTSYGMTHEVGIRRAGPWGKKLTALRTSVSRTLEGLVNQAVSDVKDAMPFRKSWGYRAKMSKSLDLSAAPDTEVIECAVKAAVLVSGCRPMADQVALSLPLQEASEEMQEIVQIFSGALISQLRDAEEDEREHGIAYLEFAVCLTETLVGAEEADLLRRRGHMASAA